MHQALYRPGRHPAPPAILNLGFIELTTDQPDLTGGTLSRLGFSAVGTHRNRPATLYRQGAIHILLSADRAGYARQFRNAHSTSACAFALQVDDAPYALEYAESSGAQRHRKNLANELDVNIPALVGPGQTLVYLMDEFAEDVFQQLEFKPASNDGSYAGDCGLTGIEQITLYVDQEYAEPCVEFYRHALNLTERKGCLPTWDVASRTAQCLGLENGHGCINFEITGGPRRANMGEVGVIHLATSDIHTSVDRLRSHSIEFSTPCASGADAAGTLGNDPKVIQSVGGEPLKASPALLRARTMPILGDISIELVQAPAPD